ncbi:Hcp family type VI secretion system effector [Paraburkholderia unamae]|uniref:Type VI secretion system secreted protein Hcp n=1 Tax=Paraburkholderia unamae TaxID=219649 RepID=A0ABX5KVC4_9BURK|nr:type VI secretion system tube protein Hcp [Paraburkholderia unamae]PVX85170.1 type VI secretion system secreted protein Hcp [Paraburkholderia unamae]RAR65740.1 type VI secretion system secreted protein Hcp [Paraburkholderia unamae]CAG9252790.1 Type VI secretion system secreted protein Hcp [Paraburkholderia unamae]
MDTILLELKDIKGNSRLDEHTDKIIIESFSFGLALPISPDPAKSERTLGRPSFNEVGIAKYSDQSTPALYSACAAGTKLGDATVLVGRNEAGKFMLHMKYVLKNAMISVINSSAGGAMMDNLSINFTQVTAEYTQQDTTADKKGTAAFGWDLATNKAITPPKS